MLKETLMENQIYEAHFKVCTNIESFYAIVYDIGTDVVGLTDEFIDKVLGWGEVTKVVNEITKAKPKLQIALLGVQLKFEIPNTYFIKKSWNSPTMVSQVLSHLYDIQRSTRTNKNNRVYNDFIMNSKDSNDLISYILKNPELSMSFIRELLGKYKEHNSGVLSLENRLATLQLVNQTLSDDIAKKDKDLEKLQSTTIASVNKYNSLVGKINNKYGVPYNTEGAMGYDLDKCNYNKILYIKEISRVKYVDTLIYYLQLIMSTLHTVKTRSIVIETPGAFRKSKLYPKLTLDIKLTYNSLIYDDILFMGYQKDLISTVLQNTAGFKYLIILDRTGIDYTYVRGRGVVNIFTASDINDVQHYNVSKTNVISYSNESLYIPNIDGFESMTIEERIKAYSSFQVVQELIKAMEV